MSQVSLKAKKPFENVILRHLFQISHGSCCVNGKIFKCVKTKQWAKCDDCMLHYRSLIGNKPPLKLRLNLHRIKDAKD